MLEILKRSMWWMPFWIVVWIWIIAFFFGVIAVYLPVWMKVASGITTFCILVAIIFKTVQDIESKL